MSIPMVPDPDNRRTSNVACEYQTCPQCECPHKLDADTCSFCGAKLSNKITVSKRWKRAVEKVKWRYKLKTSRRSPGKVVKNVASKFVTLIFGVALSAIGAWFFFSAAQGSGLTNFLLGAIFMLYGVYAIVQVVKK